MDRPYRDADWLEERYHGDGLTQREIAEECGVVPRTIRRWMQRFDIETREVRGEHHGLYGTERSEEVKRKISEQLKGREYSRETRKRISEGQRGISPTPEQRAKISKSLTGLKRPIETREKMSRSTSGEKNPNWKGGFSKRYGEGWSVARDRVRDRDEVCQHCGEDGSTRKLHVHHIVPVRVYRESENLDLKDAHTVDNLVLLCNRCHGRAEHGLIDVS